MIECVRCGQANSAESNFCRYCGVSLRGPAPQRAPDQPDYTITPPRPYLWKSDEIQLPDNRKTRPINMPPPPPPKANRLARVTEQDIAYGYRCPRCATQLLPRIVRKTSTAGWILFAVMLITFFPLFWIGFLIKEDVRVCPVCNLRVN